MDIPMRYLPFHRERVQVETDADRHSQNYALVAPLMDFLPRLQQPFRVEWVAARSGNVGLLAGTASPLLCELAEQQDRATLHLPIQGEGRYRVEGRTLHSRAGETLLYLPGLPHRSQTSHCAGLSLGLEPRRLAQCAATMAGEPDAAERYLPRFLQPIQFEQSDRLVAFLFGHLRRIVALIDLEPSRQVELASSLPLDQLIEKAVAVLMVPNLVTD